MEILLSLDFELINFRVEKKEPCCDSQAHSACMVYHVHDCSINKPSKALLQSKEDSEWRNVSLYSVSCTPQNNAETGESHGKTPQVPGQLLLQPVSGQKVEILCAPGWFYWVNYKGCILLSVSHSQQSTVHMLPVP